MSYGLTPRQMELLRFIRGYQLAHGGVSPTLRECAAGIGRSSKSSVHLMLSEMERHGVIRRLPCRPRAIDILLDPVAVPVPMLASAPLYAVSGPWSAQGSERV